VVRAAASACGQSISSVTAAARKRFVGESVNDVEEARRRARKPLRHTRVSKKYDTEKYQKNLTLF